MSVKIISFEKDGMQFPTIELKTGVNDGKFGFTFGLSKAKLILDNIDDIQNFVLDNMKILEDQEKRQEALKAKLAEIRS